MCVLDHVPFVVRQEEKGNYAVDTKAVIQAVIVAVVTSVLNTISTQQVVMTKMDMVQDDVKEMRREITEIRKDIYIPINKGRQ